MSAVFTRSQILTIPNLISIFRILLLPLLVWQYCWEENYISSIIILLLSGISDIADGIIARKYNMVSDFGKIIDPIADKLTQCAMIGCLAVKYRILLLVSGVFVFEEAFLTLMSCFAMKKKNTVNGAKWYGKVNTIIIYSMIVLLVILPGISSTVVNVMAGVCMITMTLSFLLYVNFFKNILKL